MNNINIKRGLPLGGQALPNGVMIRSSDKTAIVLRLRSGSIVSDCWQNGYVRVVNKPFLRGNSLFFDTLYVSLHALFRALRLLKASDGLVLSVKGIVSFLYVGLLIYLYTLGAGWLENLPHDQASFITDYVLFALLYGFVNLLLFCFVMFMMLRLPFVDTLLRYHGAEHKAISCYENGFNMTVQNVKSQSRLHRRCGTSMVVMIALTCIVISIILPPQLPELWKSLILLVGMVISAAIIFEHMRSKRLSLLTRIGLSVQRITTREPSDEMIQCAIAAVSEVTRT